MTVWQLLFLYHFLLEELHVKICTLPELSLISLFLWLSGNSMYSFIWPSQGNGNRFSLKPFSLIISSYSRILGLIRICSSLLLKQFLVLQKWCSRVTFALKLSEDFHTVFLSLNSILKNNKGKPGRRQRKVVYFLWSQMDITLLSHTPISWMF